MELPPDVKKFRGDLYRMLAGAAILGADLGVLMVVKPTNPWEKTAVIGSGIIAGTIGGVAGMRMASENYELRNHEHKADGA